MAKCRCSCGCYFSNSNTIESHLLITRSEFKRNKQIDDRHELDLDTCRKCPDNPTCKTFANEEVKI